MRTRRGQSSPRRRPSEPGRARFLIAIAVAACLSTLVLAASADTRPRIVVLSGDYALARRVSAEAEAAGFAVVELDSRLARGSDAALIEQNAAVALIRLVSPDRAELELGQATEGPSKTTLLRRPTDGDAFALRVVEEAHARLVELKIIPDPARPTAEPAAAATNSANPQPALQSPEPARSPERDRGAARNQNAPSPKLWATGGLAATAPGGGLGATLHAAFGARVEPMPRFNIAAQALLPLSENNLTGPEGSADASVSLFLGKLGFALVEPARNLSIEGGLGAGVVVLSMNAETEPPRSATTDRMTAGVYFVHAGAVWSLASWFRLTMALLGGVSAPRPVLRFDGRDVASWGRPFGGIGLSTEFGLPLAGPDDAR